MSRHTEVQGNKVLSGIPGMLGKHVSGCANSRYQVLFSDFSNGPGNEDNVTPSNQLLYPSFVLFCYPCSKKCGC